MGGDCNRGKILTSHPQHQQHRLLLNMHLELSSDWIMQSKSLPFDCSLNACCLEISWKTEGKKTQRSSVKQTLQQCEQINY